MEAWTIKQLYSAMQADLASCGSQFERANVKAICGREIREKAHEWAKARKLTPFEVAIAEQFGFLSSNH
jgi:hypothetical protein